MDSIELQERTQRALLMFIALSKVQNESYTHFLGMFKHSEKQKFNDLIRASESFMKTVSVNLRKDEIDAVDKLEVYFQEFVFSLVKNGVYDEDKLFRERLDDLLGGLSVDDFDDSLKISAIISVKELLNKKD